MNTILKTLSNSDATLGKLIKQIGPLPPHVESEQSAYGALLQAVTYQQLTGKAADAILTRFKALYPNGAFPSPDALLLPPMSSFDWLGSRGPKSAT